MPIRLYIDNDYTDNIITNILNRQKRTLIISSTKDKITKLANKTYEHIERDTAIQNKVNIDFYINDIKNMKIYSWINDYSH